MEGEPARCPRFLGKVQGLMSQGLRSEPGANTGYKTISYYRHHHHHHDIQQCHAWEAHSTTRLAPDYELDFDS